MDDKTIEWAKTILISQAILPRLVRAITKESNAMLDMGYMSRHYSVGQSTEDFLNEMLNMSIRKRQLVNLYSVVKDILEGMNEEESSLLRDRFIAKKCVDELMPKANIRTVYRRYNVALNTFMRELMRRGYTVDVLEEKFLKEPVIRGIYHGVVFKQIKFTSEKVAKVTLSA